MSGGRATPADSDLTELISARVRDIPDYPQPGIVFEDITPLLADGSAFTTVVGALAAEEGVTTSPVLISKEIVHALTSLDAERAAAADLAHIARGQWARLRHSGPMTSPGFRSLCSAIVASSARTTVVSISRVCLQAGVLAEFVLHAGNRSGPLVRQGVHGSV